MQSNFKSLLVMGLTLFSGAVIAQNSTPSKKESIKTTEAEVVTKPTTIHTVEPLKVQKLESKKLEQKKVIRKEENN